MGAMGAAMREAEAAQQVAVSLAVAARVGEAWAWVGLVARRAAEAAAMAYLPELGVVM